MAIETGNETRPSLLIRLKHDQSEDAWERFYELYSPLIYHFACTNGCNDAAAKDVLQETLLVLSRTLSNFEYDPTKGSFRSWLLRIVHSRIMDSFRREQRFHKRKETATPIEAPCQNDFEEAWEKQWRHNLLTQGIRELEQEITPTVYQTFQYLEVERKSVEDVADLLGISANTVYQHRHRAVKKLKLIVERLAAEMGETK